MKQGLIFIFILTIMGCAWENIGIPSTPLTPTGTMVRKAEGEIRPEVVATPEMARYLIRVTDSTVVYGINMPDQEKLTVGRIIIGNPSELSQYGFIRKITERLETSHEIVLSTVPASLGDAFKHLNIDVIYNHNGESLERDPNTITLTQFPPIIIPLGAGGNGAAVTIPSFGYTGGLVFRVSSNASTGEIEEIVMGLENFKYELQLDTRLELVASTDKVSKEFTLPINFPMAVPIGPYIVTIVASFTLTPTIEPSARGIFDFKQSIKPGPFTMLMKIKPYELLLNNAFTTEVSGNIPPQFNDLEYDFEIKDLVGEAASEYKVPISLVLSPLGLSDLASAGIELNLLSYNFSAKTETNDGILQARITSGYQSGANFFINSDFLGGILNGAKAEGLVEFLPPYELEVFDVTLSEDVDIYTFPCSKNYTLVRVDSECVGDEVEYKVRVNTSTPGNTGYKVTLGTEDIGVYAYNQLHTFRKPANQVPSVQDLIIKDEETFGCLVKRTVLNKCQITVACAPNSEFTDTRDGETYCYVVSNGIKVLSKNLNYSGAGVCYNNSSDNCLLMGRMYSFEEAQTACPAGWRLPTVAEFRKILDTEASSLSPLLSNSGNNGNGLNFLPGGEYHPWADNGEQFSGSFFDSGADREYFYWTSDEQINNSSIGAPNSGAAFDVYSKVPVATPKEAGYPCRCIQR